MRPTTTDLISPSAWNQAGLLATAAQRAIRYVQSIAEKRTAPTADEIAGLEKLGGPLPQESSDPAKVLALLDDVGSPGTVACTGGRYFGFVTGGVLPAALAANWLAAAWDQNAAHRVMSPVAARIEDLVLSWLVELLDLPSSTAGGLVTGATTANFTALAAARHALLRRAG